MKNLREIFKENPALLDLSYDNYKRMLIAAALANDKEFSNAISALLKYKKEEIEVEVNTIKKELDERCNTCNGRGYMTSIKLELPEKKACIKCGASYCISPATQEYFIGTFIKNNACFECFKKWLKENFGTMEAINKER